MANRKCFLGCKHFTSLHGLPKEDGLRQQWEEFSGVQVTSSPSLLVCSRHFTDCSFLNKAQFDAGFAKKLILKATAVPSLHVREEDTEPQAGIDGSFCQIFPAVRHVGSQTDPPEIRSVGTQLSMKTLQNHFRSTATQVKVPSRDYGVCTLTFPLDSPLLLLQPTIVERPSKRPRLSHTDEEEGPSECSLSMVVQEPDDST